MYTQNITHDYQSNQQIIIMSLLSLVRQVNNIHDTEGGYNHKISYNRYL